MKRKKQGEEYVFVRKAYLEELEVISLSAKKLQTSPMYQTKEMIRLNKQNAMLAYEVRRLLSKKRS